MPCTLQTKGRERERETLTLGGGREEGEERNPLFLEDCNSIPELNSWLLNSRTFYTEREKETVDRKRRKVLDRIAGDSLPKPEMGCWRLGPIQRPLNNARVCPGQKFAVASELFPASPDGKVSP